MTRLLLTSARAILLSSREFPCSHRASDGRPIKLLPQTSIIAGKRIHRSRRRGVVLFIVLIVVLMIALAAYGFTFFMRIEYRATKKMADQAQAEAAAQSGAEWILAYLEAPAAERSMMTLSQTGTALEESEIVDGESDAWRFAIVSPMTSSSALDSPLASSLRVGWEDESAKINLLALSEWEKQHPGHAEQVLNQFPDMDPSTRMAVLAAMGIQSTRSTSSEDNSLGQWDESNSMGLDIETSLDQVDGAESIDTLPNFETGATEQDLSSQLQRPSLSASMDPVTQLRSLMAPTSDWNRNYREDEAASTNWLRSSPTDPNQVNVDLSLFEDSAEEMQVNWRDWVTLDSAERNESSMGRPRIDVNEGDISLLHQRMLEVWPSEWANFIVLYRQYGPTKESSSSSKATVQSASQYAVDLTQSGKVPIESLFDLVGATIVIPQSEENKIKITSPFPNDPSLLASSLSRLLDEATTRSDQRIVGRINIMTASRPVLMAIPGLDDSLADRILESRDQQASSSEETVSIAWLLSLEDVDLGKLKQIEPYITTRGDVVKAQIVGYRDQWDPMHRFVGIFDGTVYPARLTHYQEFHSLGRGFNTSQLDALLSSPTEKMP